RRAEAGRPRSGPPWAGAGHARGLLGPPHDGRWWCGLDDRVAPHAPERGSAGQRDVTAGAEAVALVERAGAVAGRLQVGGHAVAVAALEHRRHEGCSEPGALLLGPHPEELQVVVGLLRRVRLEQLDDLEQPRRVDPGDLL